MTDYSELSNEKLNALVAERIMGWECHISGIGVGWWDGDRHVRSCGAWNPAEILDHAMMVAEILGGGGTFTQNSSVAHQDLSGDRWWADFGDLEADGWVIAETLPRAICLAALNRADVGDSG
jgi:hypothetical protein